MNGSLLLVGLAGPELTAAEVALVRELQPAGFVLGAHNLDGPEQTRRLTDSLRNLSQRPPLVALAQSCGPIAALCRIAPTVPAPSAIHLRSAGRNYQTEAAGRMPAPPVVRAFCPRPEWAVFGANGPVLVPTPAALAAHGDAQVIGTAGMLTGEFLRMLGVNFHFAPTLNLDHHPAAENSGHEGGWGRDPQRVIDHAGQWNRWLRKRGVASCANFFPAGGRAGTAPEHEFPVVTATLAELLREDLLPYTALMPELDAILVGHQLIPHLDADLPASLSPRLIRRLLRDQLGFDHHVVLPDALEVVAITRRFGLGPAARLALEAGNDLVRVGPQPAAARAAAAALASLPHLMLAEAWERVERLRDKLHWPPPWAAEKVAETAAKLAALADQVSKTETGD